MKKLSLVAALLAATTAYAEDPTYAYDSATGVFSVEAGKVDAGATAAGANTTPLRSATGPDGTSNILGGNLTVNGRITDQTCQISADSKDITVTLPTVPEASFTAQGQVAGWKPFTVTVQGCKTDKVVTGAEQVYINFTPVANQLLDEDTTTGLHGLGLLKNTGSATGVAIQLTNADAATEINLTPELAKAFATTPSATFTDNDTIKGKAITDGKIVLQYGAQYYAIDGTVTAGDVTATTAYSLAYR